MNTENYISPNKITKQYDITSGTLRRWAEAGKIRCIRPNGGKRIYNIEDVKKIFNSKEMSTPTDVTQTNDTQRLNEIMDKLKSINDLESYETMKADISSLLTKIGKANE